MTAKWISSGSRCCRTGTTLRWCAALVLTTLVSATPIGCGRSAPPVDQGRRQRASEQTQERFFTKTMEGLADLDDFTNSEMLKQQVNRVDQWLRKQEPPRDWQADPYVTSLREKIATLVEQTGAVAVALERVAQAPEAEDGLARIEALREATQTVAESYGEVGQAYGLEVLTGNAQDFGDMLARLERVTARESTAVAQAALLARQIDPQTMRTLAEMLGGFQESLDIDAMRMLPTDGSYLRQAVFLRDLAAWTHGEKQDPLARAEAIFDWLVRNIELLPDATVDNGIPDMNPWEAMFFGRADQWGRTWLFLELLHRERIDACVLGIEDPEALGGVRPWAVGVLQDDEVYLFDFRLGLPIPGPDGVVVDQDTGQPRVRPATLAQVNADPSLLDRMRIDDDATPYVEDPAMLDEMVAMIAMTPPMLSRRMETIEDHLSGDLKFMLTLDPSGLKQRLGAIDHIGKVEYWTHPYHVTLVQYAAPVRLLDYSRPFLIPTGGEPALASGRILHLKGQLIGEPSATQSYQTARVPDRQLISDRIDVETRILLTRTKLAAGYWLGLINVESHQYDSAVDYFYQRTLGLSNGGAWRSGALYNLGRVHEMRSFALLAGARELSEDGDDEAAAAMSQKAQEALAEAERFYGALANAPNEDAAALRAKWVSELVPAATIGGAGAEASDDSSSEPTPGASQGPTASDERADPQKEEGDTSASASPSPAPESDDAAESDPAEDPS